MVGEQRLVGEDGDGLAQRVVVVGAEEYGDAMSVAGDLESLVRALRLVDETGELRPCICHRKSRHVHNSS